MTIPVPKPETTFTSFFEGNAEARQSFLQIHDWSDAKAQLVAEDWAARRFWRLEKRRQICILMESVPDDHPLSTPGHKIADTLKITDWLRSIGIHVPEIFGHDVKGGFILMEDLGSETLPDTEEAYREASKVLKTIQQNYQNNSLSLPAYKGGYIDQGKQRIIDWYLPLIRGRQNEGDEAQAYLKIWEEIEAGLPSIRQTFLHCDFHAENLMWLEGGRIGVLDFQGAHFGPAPYDLTNLLNDNRRDIPQDRKGAVYHGFCADMNAKECEAFDIWFLVLSSQFHSRITGQLIKLYSLKQDEKYLAYLPRMLGYLKEELECPVLKPLKRFYDDIGLDLKNPAEVTPEKIMQLVSDQAF